VRRPLAVILFLAAVVAGVWAMQPAAADLVVYCAHDSVYAEPFLARFTADTGVTVQVRYDTEATKSLGLTELIERESSHPRCDVFWNNEPLGTIRLARLDLLHPYQGSGQSRIPAAFRDPRHRWIGFAGRLRVWIVHTPTLDPSVAAITASLAEKSLDHVAIAKPLYGTTRSHLTALWEQSGPEATRAWHRDLRRRGVRVVNGNAVVKDLVSAGACALGLTDTDDYHLARDAGRPVAMVPATLGDGSTLCIPNTAAIVKGCRDLTAAGKLIDYLTSAASELALARSPSRQIPLGPVPMSSLPADVRRLLSLARRSYAFRDQGAASTACLQWLRGEYAR
jgi:iron(III) transport system substrate-binding protein